MDLAGQTYGGASAKDGGKCLSSLLFALSAQVKKDHVPDRERLFHLFLRRVFPLGYAYELVGNGPVISRAFVSLLYGCTVSAKARFPGGAGPLSIEKLPNEREKISSLMPVFAKLGLRRMLWRISPFHCAYSLFFFARMAALHPGRLKGFIKWHIRLNKKLPLYVAMRASETALTYIFLCERWRANTPSMVLVSTDSNPHGCAAMGAAGKLRVPLVFASHGAVSSNPVAIKCWLAIFYGRRALEDYAKASSEIEQYLFYGFKNTRAAERAPIPRKICLCLGKNPNLEFVRKLTNDLGSFFPGVPLTIRPHPQGMASLGRLAAFARMGKISRHRDIQKDLDGCDLLLAGSSTAHLEAVARGVLSVFVGEMDAFRPPELCFIQEGMVPRLDRVDELPRLLASMGNAQPQGLSSFVNQEYSFEEFLGKLEAVVTKASTSVV
jgi:hypothetical protein